jgi:hypothetical protein
MLPDIFTAQNTEPTSPPVHFVQTERFPAVCHRAGGKPQITTVEVRDGRMYCIGAACNPECALTRRYRTVVETGRNGVINVMR